MKNSNQNELLDFSETNSYISDGYSFKELFYLFINNRYKILVIVLFFLIASTIYSLTIKPVYQSFGMIMIENDKSNTMNIFDPQIGIDKNYIHNEIEILKSRSIAEEVVNRLFASEYKNNLFLFGSRIHNYSWQDYLPDFIHFKKEINYDENFELTPNMKLAFINALQNSLEFSSSRNNDMVRIVGYSNSPDEAALIINTLIDVYIDFDLKWISGEISNLTQFLNQQIEEKEDELKIAENNLKLFQEKERILGGDEKYNLLMNSLLTTESEYYKITAEKNILNKRKIYIQNLLTDEEKKLSENISSSINNRFYTLKKEIAQKEAELITTITQHGEEHAIVKTIEAKLNNLINKLEKETRTIIDQGISVSDPLIYRQSLIDSIINISARSAMLDTKLNEYKKLVNRYELDLSDVPHKILNFTRLKRNFNIKDQTYSLMRQKLEESHINSASLVSRIRVVDSAEPNYDRIKPNKKRSIFMGLIFGMFFSSIVIIVIDFFNSTVKSIEEIETLGLTILGIIPRMGNRKKKNKKIANYNKDGDAEKIERRLITHEDPRSPISEAFRSLRTSISYDVSNQEDGKFILVSSPGPGEGKTTTIVNLAITFANLGKKTVLVDTDLRKPVTHKVFHVEREPGISKYLAGKEKKYSNILKKTDINNLSIITCGVIPPNPSEILASTKMQNLINELKEDFDIILFDAPPILAVTDALIMMQYLDNFILVIRPNQTEKGALKRALNQLNLANAPFSGVVMNSIDSSSDGYGGGYYYNYYK